MRLFAHVTMLVACGLAGLSDSADVVSNAPLIPHTADRLFETEAVTECSGCAAINSGSFNNVGSCLTIVDNNFSIQPAPEACVPENCAALPCTLSGGYTIQNNCSVPVYIRTKRNTTCDPGTTELPGGGGSIQIAYNSDDLACGTAYYVRIYLNNPGDSCPTSSNAGWGFTCTGCTVNPH